MSTKFDLEYPYNTKWKTGYIVINGENRKHVCLVGDDNRSSTSLARYMVSVNLGRFLTEHEHVDHIDNDKTNDIIPNLQILTPTANRAKERKRKGRLVAEIRCPVCSTIFIKRKGLTQAIPALKGKISSCSPACSHTNLQTLRTAEERAIISEDTLLRVYRLCDE